MNSDTPRCDLSKWNGHCGDGDWQDVVGIEVCRKIERELIEANNIIEGLRDNCRRFAEARRDRDQWRQVAERLASVLKSETWQHLCANGVGGCLAVSDSAVRIELENFNQKLSAEKCL